jgi:hypothetical protein
VWLKSFPRNNDKVIVESIGTISVKGDCDYVRRKKTNRSRMFQSRSMEGRKYREDKKL